MNKNDVFTLLNIPYNSSLIIGDISEDTASSSIIIHISKVLSPVFCPVCSSRLHSKGIYTRTINHTYRQDGYKTILIVSQRRFSCPACGEKITESFSFLERYRHSSSLAPLLVLDAMKDLNCSAVSIAAQFNI